MTRCIIKGTGSYLPQKILTNFDIEKMVDTSNDWIIERTGIKKRHIAAENEVTSDLAMKAAQRAMENAKVFAGDIDLIIVATTTPDRTFPATAVIAQQKLGIEKAAAFDLQAVCSGFVYGLSVANAMLLSGNFKRALVIGAETMSRIVDWQDRNTCILFGDGAGAVVLERDDAENSRGILATTLRSDDKTVDILNTSSGTSTDQKSGFVFMEGKEVFKHAITKLAESTIEGLNKSGVKAEDIDWVIPHQANKRILDGTIKKLNVPQEKLISTVSEHANTSAASIPLALDVANREGKIKQGDLIAMQAIGGGLSWGSVVLRF